MFIGTLRGSRGLEIAALSLCSAGVGLLVSLRPSWILWAVTACALAGVITSATLRLTCLVFGALLVFQSSETFGAEKYLFFVVALFAVLGAAIRFGRLRHDQRWIAGKPIWWATSLLGIYLGVSVVRALVIGHPISTVFRDVAPYFLVCAAPLLATDTATAVPAAVQRGVLVVAGATAAASTFVRYASLRGLTELPLERLLFPSAFLGAALVYFAAAIASSEGHGRFRWSIVAATTLTALLLTGTRSNLLILLPFIAIALASRGGLLARVFKAFSAFVWILGIGGIVMIVTIRLLDFNVTVLGARVVSGVQILLSDPYQDASFNARLEQSREALRHFLDSPALGGGPGLNLSSGQVLVAGQTGTVIDSPLSLAAKFGVVGCLLLFALIGAAALDTWRYQHGGRILGTHFALLAYLALFTIVTVLLWPAVEDKGAPIGFWLLLGLVLTERLRSVSSPPATPVSPDSSDTESDNARLRTSRSFTVRP